MLSLFKKLLAPYFVNKCISCHTRLLDQETSICISCLYNLPRTNNYLVPNNKAEQLMAGRFPFQRIATFCKFNKQGMLQPLIHDLKYKQNPHIGFLLGLIFGKEILGSPFINEIDYIVPIPLHKNKIKSRGYNQAEIIANGISHSTHIPMSVNNLIRVINNPTQTKLSKTQRWENVKGIFSVERPEEYINKHILLIDDIITTGSTIEACAIATLHIQGIKISVATLGEAF